MIWDDLKERFDKVNASRVYQLHKEIATLVQGTDSISVYFSKLRHLWAEFDSMTPPSCDCTKSKEFMQYMQGMKVMQFLMGLNENYEQARSQILMTSPTPTINKAYSMLIERESQRSIASSLSSRERLDLGAMMAGKGNSYNKPQKNWNLQCDYCKLKGHTMNICYKLVGYPPGYRGKKKERVPPASSNTHNDHAENVNAHIYKGNTAYNVQTENVNPNAYAGNLRTNCLPGHGDFQRAPHLTNEQHERIANMLDKEGKQEHMANMAGPCQWDFEGD